MNDIKLSIEIRIEAGSEGAARKYATAHGIDVNGAKWHRNPGEVGGRLYALVYPHLTCPSGKPA